MAMVTGYRGLTAEPEGTWEAVASVLERLPLPDTRELEKMGARESVTYITHPVIGFLGGRLGLGVPDAAYAAYGRNVAKSGLMSKLTKKGLTVNDISQRGEPLWRVDDTHGNTRFINPDRFVEDSYEKDLGETWARWGGLDVTPEMQTVYDAGKFIGSLKTTIKLVKKGTAAPINPRVLRTLQVGLAGFTTDTVLQVEDIIADKRETFSIKQAVGTGAFFVAFGGVMETISASRQAIAGAYMTRSYIQSHQHLLKDFSHKEIKLLLSAQRSAGAMSFSKWSARYNKPLKSIVDKLDKAARAEGWKPPTASLIAEKSGIETVGISPKEMIAEPRETLGKQVQAKRAFTQTGEVRPQERFAPSKRNPYLTMPTEKVIEDAQYGVKLAQEALARIDPSALLSKDVISPATKAHKATAHILKAKHQLTDEQYRRVLRYSTGQDSMTTMNVEQAKTAIEHLKQFKDMVELTKEAAKAKTYNIDPRISKDYVSKISKAARSDEALNRTMMYNDKAGGVPSSKNVPGLDWRQKRYSQDLVNIANLQGKAIRREIAREAVGKDYNVVNPWSSARYALAQAGVKSGVPLRRMYSDVVAKAVNVRNQNVTTLEGALKKAGVSRIGSPLSFKEGKQIAGWLFTNPEKQPIVKTTLWNTMKPRTQRVAVHLHKFLQNESALQVRWARWIKWDRAAKRADLTIQQLRDKGVKITKKRLDTIMKPVKTARPRNAPQSALIEGRLAEENGQLLDWMHTQKWGTLKHYYMSEKELVDLTKMYPSGTIPEQLEQVAARLGGAPEMVLPETMTREGLGKIAKGGSLLNAILNHSNRVGTFAATYDDLQKFWKAFASANPSPSDIASVRALVNTSLGFRHTVEPWVKIGRFSSAWFWRGYFAFSPKRSAWFSLRNFHQNLAYGPSQSDWKELAKSAITIEKHVLKKVAGRPWPQSIDRVNPWLREDYARSWESVVSQKRQMWHQFILQRQGGVVSDFGNRAVGVIDVLAAPPMYSDEVNRLQIWPLMHQTAYRNVQNLVKGKISAKQFWKALSIDNLHVDQRIEMHQLMDKGKWRQLVNNWAEYRTENVHGRYDIALRSIVEQTPGGRLVAGLKVFPTLTFEIMYQNGLKPFIQGFESGAYRQSYEGMKTMIAGIAGSRVARWSLYAITGRKAYGMFDTVFRYTPVAPGPARIQDLFDVVNMTLWQAEEQDYSMQKTADVIMATAMNQVELFIPFCDVMIDISEVRDDDYGKRLYSLLKNKALKHYKDEEGRKFSPANRDSIEKLQHAFWGGAEKGKEFKKEDGKLW